MKKTIIVVLIVALITILLAGCGGSTEETAQPDQEQATQDTASSQQAAQQQPTRGSTTGTSTDTKSKVPRELEYTKGSLPSEFEKAVEDGFVTVVAMYSDDSVSIKVSDSVDEVIESIDYKDQIKYLSYEITGKTSSSVARLTTALNVKYMPSITIIDRDKNVVFEKSGFIEKSFFSHKLFNVVYKDKSPE